MLEMENLKERIADLNRRGVAYEAKVWLMGDAAGGAHFVLPVRFFGNTELVLEMPGGDLHLRWGAIAGVQLVITDGEGS